MHSPSFQIKMFAVVGVVNTCFGYLLGVTLFMAFRKYIDAFFISFTASFLSIGFSTLMHRRYVFKSNNSIISDLRRGYLVYTSIICITAALFKAIIDYLNVSVFFAQMVVLVLSWGLSFYFLKNYAFRVEE
ncbi:hypothetical protein LSUCC0387_05405 [Rhodobacterales bacterium LSUCC0387]|nr:hypothetical protein [Rhodobacterales bacterium LSUCC0387]